jgi:hypothetical protein
MCKGGFEFVLTIAQDIDRALASFLGSGQKCIGPGVMKHVMGTRSTLPGQEIPRVRFTNETLHEGRKQIIVLHELEGRPEAWHRMQNSSIPESIVQYAKISALFSAMVPAAPPLLGASDGAFQSRMKTKNV